jgi:hypothetical protein
VFVFALLGPVAAFAAPEPTPPKAALIPDVLAQFTGNVDSNTPVVWSLVDGRWSLVATTSVAGQPSRASGFGVTRLGPATPVMIDPWPGEGVWMESIVPAEDGSWYGYYHNERHVEGCGDTKVAPRIGAARSIDNGRTWQDLGPLIEASPASFVCDTPNVYFVGGVGDLNAVLDTDGQYLYVYFSEYGRDVAQQGVAVARMAWADRDEPAGKLDFWSDGAWVPGAAPTPIFPTLLPWHVDSAVDAFWGPSIHWNSYLGQYVMVLNHARDEAFGQEGVYVSFNATLANPAGWSAPVKLLDGGAWYPEVIGTEPRVGTDRLAAEQARFYMGGKSSYMIRFTK